VILHREAWKSYEGFPKNNAALAYVYIVNQVLSGAVSAPDGSVSGSAGNNGFGAIVSTLK
jgi:hypothetical protein